MVSDIHGYVNLLKRLLIQAKYQPGGDILILLGDMIEKGPQSLETLHYIMDLASIKDVFVIMGNCDAIPCSIFQKQRPAWLAHYLNHTPWLQHTLIREMCIEQDIEVSENMDFDQGYDHILSAYPEEMHFLNTLPHVIECEFYIFVHGGLRSEQQPYAENAHQIMKNDYHALQEIHYEKTLICGHTPVMNYDTEMFNCNPHYDRKRNIISIDGGCGVKDYGQLNLLLLENEKYTSIACDTLTYYEVIKAYHPNQSISTAIPWVSHEVERLYPGEKGIIARHIATGHVVEIPNAFLKEIDGIWICDDYSNYHIDVDVGDMVAVITTCDGESWIKKNGEIGWIPSNCLSYPK